MSGEVTTGQTLDPKTERFQPFLREVLSDRLHNFLDKVISNSETH
jgi:hypothetical protein